MRGALAALLVATAAGAQTPQLVDDFEGTGAWTAAPSDGVSLALAGDDGRTGRALRLDVDFHGGGGYAVARRALSLDLPANYALTFWIRGTVPPNTLEFKLLDASGQNVWWATRPDMTFARGWTKVTIRRRQISFAWGPQGGGELRHAAGLELAVTAGEGGKGSVWLDDLTLTPLPPQVTTPLAATPSASSSRRARGASLVRVASQALDGSPEAARQAPNDVTAAGGWHSDADGEQWLALDFGASREYGALVVDWDAADRAVDYDVETSDDGRTWTTARAVRGAGPGRRWHLLTESESRWLRLRLLRSARGQGYAVRAVHVLPLAAGATPTAFMESIAAASPAGRWPRAFVRQQSYWTVVGVPGGGRHAALLGEDGGFEPFPSAPSLEPFLFADGRLLTWKDGTTTQALDGGGRPIPTVTRAANGLTLAVTAFADGDSAAPTRWVRYRVTNTTARARTARLAVALRPLQVNPPWQFLSTTGGAATVNTLDWDGRRLTVNDSAVTVVPLTVPNAAGALAFDGGSVVDSLAVGRVPAGRRVADPTGMASAAMTWELALPARGSADVVLALPPNGATVDATNGAVEWTTRLTAARARWDSTLDRVSVALPAAATPLARAMRSARSHVLINADGAAIRPGTRSYARSWIRDGALTSTALLRFGHADAVRAFLDWYAPFQYANGKVPCCVDRRGAGPVPEHDSQGEFVYLVAEYVRHSGDTATARRMWPHVARAVAYADSLRRSRTTDVYRAADSLHLFGLLPPSISHEGYSDKAAYSYWDDFFNLRGLSDAAWLARSLGTPDAARYAELERTFRADFAASIERAMRVHRIPFIPGAADRGDFDATSTTIALSPGNDLGWLPRAAVDATFDRYWREFVARRDGAKAWENYTPYEWRTVGSFVRLGRPERAWAAIDFFMRDRRPEAWNAWAEVVWRDARAPKFVGDLPHGWVASDFLRSTLDLLAYEREADSALVVGAGVPRAWFARAGAGDVRVRGLSSWWGALDLTIARVDAATVRLSLSGARPPGGVEVHAPFGARPRAATVNGVPAALGAGGAVVVRALPATVEFRY